MLHSSIESHTIVHDLCIYTFVYVLLCSVQWKEVDGKACRLLPYCSADAAKRLWDCIGVCQLPSCASIV